jgi:hypothetical protein
MVDHPPSGSNLHPECVCPLPLWAGPHPPVSSCSCDPLMANAALDWVALAVGNLVAPGKSRSMLAALLRLLPWDPLSSPWFLSLPTRCGIARLIWANLFLSSATLTSLSVAVLSLALLSSAPSGRPSKLLFPHHNLF